MRATLRFAGSVLLYVTVVIGGITLFLIFVPLFGYLPYSDRPGPGWFGSFPALGWGEFWANALKMLEFGLFFAILFLVPGVICVSVIRLLERFVRRPAVIRLCGALVAALLSGYWMLGAGWYISAGLPLLVLAVLLGVAAGAWALPNPNRPDTLHA